MADTRDDPKNNGDTAGEEQRAGSSRNDERAGSSRNDERAAERARAQATRAKTVRWATSIVSIGSALFAVVLGMHIVFVVFGANTENPLVTFAADVADSLVIFFHDLFTPEDNRVGVLVNYGMAAIFWLVVGRIVIALLRRIR